MSFTKLREALVNQAEADIASLRERSATEYAQAQQRITERAQQLEEDIIRAAETAGALEAQRLHQAAKHAARADILRTKQAEVEAVREDVIQHILGWPAAEAQRLIAALFELIPEQQGSITAGAVHAALVRKLAKQHGFSVAAAEIANDGGFLFRGERAELNATVRRLVHELFRRHRTELAAILYG